MKGKRNEDREVDFCTACLCVCRDEEMENLSLRSNNKKESEKYLARHFYRSCWRIKVFWRHVTPSSETE